MTFDEAGRRAIGLASFDPGAYEELRDDPAATVPAVGIVIAATVLQAIGGVMWGRFGAPPPPIFQVDLRHLVLYSAVFGSVIQIAMWCGWVAMTWFWLRYILSVEDVQWQRLVRTMGFAFAPMALQILLVFPVLEFPVGLFALGATVACSVLAVRAATGATAGQAAFATLMGAFLFVLVLGVLGNSDTDLAPGIFALDPNAISVRLELKNAGP
jgi:hypothetical protein